MITVYQEYLSNTGTRCYSFPAALLCSIKMIITSVIQVSLTPVSFHHQFSFSCPLLHIQLHYTHFIFKLLKAHTVVEMDGTFL